MEQWRRAGMELIPRSDFKREEIAQLGLPLPAPAMAMTVSGIAAGTNGNA
jgi:hypothetical protein